MSAFETNESRPIKFFNSLTFPDHFFFLISSTAPLVSDLASISLFENSFKKYLKNLSIKFNYLEIGSYEGNSAIFVATNYPNSSILCVDPWEPYEEKEKENFNLIENRFDFNIKDLKNIKKNKKTSDNFFLNNKEKFDFIYIDGFHRYDYVLRDCYNAWDCLKIGGIIACDDYIWQAWNDIKLNPCYAINKFIKDKQKEIKILTVTKSQIFFKKIKYGRIT